MEEIYEIESNVKNPPDNSVVLTIKDYDSVGWYFDKYCGDKKISECVVCGSIFKKKTNNQKCCSDDCSTFLDREKAKERMKNIRED